MGGTSEPDLGAVWAAYCDGLRRLGAEVLASPHATDDVARAEGIRHLARMVAMSLTQWIDFSDPAEPRLFRSNDDVWQWGGPNVDNVYLGAPIDPRGTYRLTGDLSGQPGAILQVLGRPAPGDPIAVRVDRNLVEVSDPDGRVELVLTGDGSVAADVSLPEDGHRIVLREYFPSLECRRAGFALERLDEAPGSVPLSGPRLAEAIDGSGRWLAQNIAFWQDYTARRRDEVGVNRIEPPGRGPGMGSESIAYSTGFYELDENQCLVVTIDEPKARYWALQLYSLGWYEALDVAFRQTSLNHTQSHVDSDGRVRFVIAATDPGVPNWLDATGHPSGMLHFRAVWCNELPSASAESMKLSDLCDRLPSDHPTVTARQRTAALVERRRLMQRRFAR